LLALCPPNIDPSSLSVMVAFAVGGLLGDTIFHLLPEIFLGESSPEHARFVLVEPNKNLLLGVAIMVGFVTFVAMDKGLRIATGGEGGHDHSHGAKKKDAEKEEDVGPGGKTTSAEWATRNGDVRSRNISSTGATGASGEADLPILSIERRKELLLLDEPERCKKWIEAVLHRDPESYVTQVVLWRAYESQLKGYGKGLIPPTEFIKRVHDVFDDAQLQNINLQTPHGTEKQYIIKGVKSRSSPTTVNQDRTELDHPAIPIASGSPSAASSKPTTASTTPSPSIRLSAYLNLIADFTHNITDGLAISSSFYASPTLGATTTVAVFFHEIPHEVGDFALLIQSGFSKSRAMGAQFVTALGAFLGTCLGIMVQEFGKHDKPGTSSTEIGGNNLGLLGTGLGWGDLLLPFTAGTFLYVGTVAVIPDLLETGGDRSAEIRKTTKQFLAMALGAGIMLT
jgi:zinc transporter ZupT